MYSVMRIISVLVDEPLVQFRTEVVLNEGFKGLLSV